MRSHAPRLTAAGVPGLARLLRTRDGVLYGASDGIPYVTREDAQSRTIRDRAQCARAGARPRRIGAPGLAATTDEINN
jgi:hypothetical protein